MTDRISREEFLIEMTKLISRRGTCLRAQVGCVLAIDGRPIASGYNGSEPGEPHCIDAGCLMEEGHCVRTIHAEANAIAWSARKGIAIEGATLYTYGWESGICHRCRKLALSAGIVKIVEIPMETAEDASFFKGETINFDDKTAGEPQRVHECGDPNCIVPHPAPHKKRPA